MGKALILGVDGQDGSYLAEHLLDQDEQVVGWIPGNVPVDLTNISSIRERITLVEGDLGEQEGLTACLEEYRPQEIYNFASPSSPSKSWDSPLLVGDVTALGVTRLLEAIRIVTPTARFYQASSSELFGDPLEVPQSETTPFRPRNPYGIAKLYGHWTAIRYRQQYGLYAVSGILFNHESPRRGMEFVTRKITHTAAQIKLGFADRLALGNLDARRDWGFAGDYVQAIWRMLHLDEPDDFVLGTGVTHSVREFCELAFGYLDLDYQDYVVEDARYYRPAEPNQLVADPRKAMEKLGWNPQLTFNELVGLMVEADIQILTSKINT